MQAIILMALFSFIFSLMAGIVTNGSFSSKQLTNQRIEDTRKYFTDLSKVVRTDITPDYLTANPLGSTSVESYIKGLPQLRMLSDGRFANPATDAWGTPLNGVVLTEYQPLSWTSATKGAEDTATVVTVPVTAVLLVSSGPDRVQTTQIPSPTTYTNVQSLVADGDDIVYAFDNRTEQEQILEGMRESLKRIGIAATKQLEVATSAYRATRVALYNQQIAEGKAGDLTLLDLAQDPNAPRFPCLDMVESTACPTGAANRKSLGVDAEFTMLERALPGGGRFVLTAPRPATAADPMQLILRNNATTPTPWGRPAGSFQLQIQINNTAS